MHTVKSILEHLGRPAVAARLGVGVSAIDMAASSGKFRAAWYPTIVYMCEEAGLDVDTYEIARLVSWRRADDASVFHPQEPAA